MRNLINSTAESIWLTKLRFDEDIRYDALDIQLVPRLVQDGTEQESKVHVSWTRVRSAGPWITEKLLIHYLELIERSYVCSGVGYGHLEYGFVVLVCHSALHSQQHLNCDLIRLFSLHLG